MRFKILIFLFLVSFLLTACGKINVENRDNDIMMAKDCGMDGLQCCDNDPVCSFGQECCVDPNNNSRNHCAKSCNFGEINSFCKENNECNGNLMCLDGYCKECGEENDACCQSGNSCIDGLSCDNDICVKCGVVGGPCCSNNECFNIGDKRVECKSNKCSYCGFGGNSACLEGDKCITSNLLNNGDCLKCGSYNTPCCNESSNVGYKCDSSKNLVCKLGFCIKTDVLE